MKRIASLHKLQMNNGTHLESVDGSKSSDLKPDTQDKIQGTLLNQLEKLANKPKYNRVFETVMMFKIHENNSEIRRAELEGKLTHKIRVLLCYSDDFFDQVKKILIKYSFEHTVNGKNFQKELEHRYDELFQDETYIKIKFTDTSIIYQRPVGNYTKYPYMYIHKNFSANPNTEIFSWKQVQGDPLKANKLALYFEDIAYFEKTILGMEKVFSIKIIEGFIKKYNMSNNTSSANTILMNLGKYITQLKKNFWTFERSASRECRNLLMSDAITPKDNISGALIYIRSGFLCRAVASLCDMKAFRGDQDKIMETLIQHIEGNQETNKNRFFKQFNNDEFSNKNESQCLTQYTHR